MDLREKVKIFVWASLIGMGIIIAYNFISGIIAGEEGRVRKFILRGKRAVEEKNLFKVSDILSANYQDKYGNTRSSLIYAAREFFAYYKSILVNIEKIEIKLEESKDEASVEITALVIGQPRTEEAEKILEGEKGNFKVKLIKEENKWQLLELEFFEPLRIMGQEVS